MLFFKEFETLYFRLHKSRPGKPGPGRLLVVRCWWQVVLVGSDEWTLVVLELTENQVRPGALPGTSVSTARKTLCKTSYDKIYSPMFQTVSLCSKLL